MKALVLSYDRNHTFAEHMIRSYQQHWPDHPFTFLIPYQDWPAELADRLGGTASFIKSPAAIMETFDALLQTVSDDEWVYWCIDDKYLIELDRLKANRTVAWIEQIRDPTLAGVSIARSRRMLRPAYLDMTDTIKDATGGRYIRRIDYSQIWLHQFLRGKVLKTLFTHFPRTEFQAKAMDAMKEAAPLPTEHRLFVSEENHVVFGESTTRGKLTANCSDSLISYGLRPPTEIERAEARIVIGERKQPEKPRKRFERLLTNALDRFRRKKVRALFSD